MLVLQIALGIVLAVIVLNFLPEMLALSMGLAVLAIASALFLFAGNYLLARPVLIFLIVFLVAFAFAVPTINDYSAKYFEPAYDSICTRFENRTALELGPSIGAVCLIALGLLLLGMAVFLAYDGYWTAFAFFSFFASIPIASAWYILKTSRLRVVKKSKPLEPIFFS